MQTSTDDPAESMLESACALLRHDWVKDFLFPRDRTTYVRQLHAALSQQTAITAAVHYGTQSSSVGPCENLPGLNKELSLLCVPSFSTGNITVGFEVTECLADSSPVPLGIPRYTSRFVRDDDEGLMLIIGEHPQLGVTEVTCCTLLSPGCRSQVYAVMKLRQLRAAVMHVEKGYDRSAVRRATLFAYFSVDLRACPNCGSNTISLCACALKVKRKAHPLDHDAERHNLSTYTGDFGGLAKMKVVKDGHDASVASFTSKIEAIFTCDREKQRNLATWAMSHAFSNEPVRLENYRMPGEQLLLEYGGGSHATTEEEDSAASRDVLSHSLRQSMPRRLEAAKDLQGRNLPVRKRIRRTPRRSVKPCQSMASKTTAISAALFSNSQIARPEQGCRCTPTQDGLNSVPGAEHINPELMPDRMDLLSSVEPTSSASQPPLPKRRISGNMESSRSLPSSIDQELISADKATSTSQDAQIKKGASSTKSSMPQPSLVQAVPAQLIPASQQTASAVVLLPVRPMYHGLPQALPVPLAPASVRQTDGDYQDTRSKDEIRRARNRASAQRSNEKKKREVAKLEDDLDEFVKRKQVLVERERVLRDENEDLKAALRKSSVVLV